MRANDITILICLAALGLLASGSALPQQTIHQPYDIETFGKFRRIMMAGAFSAKVRLDEAMARHPTTGVGALADARGEITIYNGKLIVSYGKTDSTGDANSESGALLAIGTVAEWQ